MRTLDLLRPTVAAAACGMAARALEEAVAHARSRRQFGSALADFQLVQAKIARMATDLAAARLLTYRAAWERDRGAERVTREVAAMHVEADLPSDPQQGRQARELAHDRDLLRQEG